MIEAASERTQVSGSFVRVIQISAKLATKESQWKNSYGTDSVEEEEVGWVIMWPIIGPRNLKKVGIVVSVSTSFIWQGLQRSLSISHVMKRKQESAGSSSSESQAKKTKKPSLPEPDSEETLQNLLDFSQIKVGKDIERRFNEIATSLLYEFHLVVRKRDSEDTALEIEFEILEAEFYLQMLGGGGGGHAGSHEDPYTHGSEEQKISGQWYFHRAPRKSADSHRSSTSLTGYRGGSRKGLDLTIGGRRPSSPPILSKHFLHPTSPPNPNPPEPQHPESKDQQLLCGGILLRSLRQLGVEGKVISGPSLLVDRIISASGASSIADLVENKWAGDTCAFISEGDERSTKLFLRPASLSTSPSPSKIYCSPRIGLDLSHPGTTKPIIQPLHPRIQFLPKLYRFFTHPDKLLANGRPQTFLGVLLSCISSTTNSDFTETLKKPGLSQEIAALMALKEPTCAKYLAEYIAGREGGVGLLNSFVGPQGKGASSSPSSYLRMMGALSNVVPL